MTRTTLAPCVGTCLCCPKTPAIAVAHRRLQFVAALAGRLHHSVCAADQDLSYLEEELLRGGQEGFRQMFEKAAQQKANDHDPQYRLS